MADAERPENERIARARQALAHFERPGQEEYEALTELMTSVRAYVEPAQFQQALDRSRTAWHREQVANGTIDTGIGPRSEVWYERLENSHIAGEHWQAWPQELKDRVVADCVRIEADAMAAPLIDWSDRTGHGATWNPELGTVVFANDEAAEAFSDQQMLQALSTAYLTVLDQYEEIESKHYSRFGQEKIEQVERLGYRCEIETRLMTDQSWTLVDPVEETVTFYDGDWEDPLVASDAQAFADFVTIAEELPPVRVDYPDKSWYRQAYLDQMKSVVDTRTLDDPTFARFMTALADARTAAINRALIGTDHVWDPRKSLPVPIPTADPPELKKEHYDAIETAKGSVDPGQVFAEITHTDPPDPVALAFPAAAPPAQVDTTAAAGTTTYASIPAPEL